jgi:hypothetical protein
VGAVVVYEFLPQIAKALRPVIVQGMKAGMGMADQMKTSGSGVKETFEDMVAEARSEYETEKTVTAGQNSRGASPSPRAKKSGA